MLTRRPHFSDNEKELQNSTALVLAAERVTFRREVILSVQDLPDFMVGSTAIEVKLKSPRSGVLRKLHRFAQHNEVTGIVWATSKAIHRAYRDGQPDPVTAYYLLAEDGPDPIVSG